jgi:hypothetical protein
MRPAYCGITEQAAAIGLPAKIAVTRFSAPFPGNRRGVGGRSPTLHEVTSTE